MSLSWRDRVRVVLRPDRVILVRLARGMRPRVSAKEILACTADGWQPALAALAGALKGAHWRRADATVILSNHFVRYLLVPWSDQLVTDEERAAWVRHTFAEVHGADAAQWEFRWSEEGPGHPQVASAVEQALLAGIREVFKGSTLRLCSLQPYAMSAFNHWRRAMHGQERFFLLAEPGRLCLASLGHDQWRSFRSWRLGEAWQDELPCFLERELLLGEAGEARPQVFLHLPEAPGFSLPAGAWSAHSLKLAPLPGFSPVGDAAYAMALCG